MQFSNLALTEHDRADHSFVAHLWNCDDAREHSDWQSWARRLEHHIVDACRVDIIKVVSLVSFVPPTRRTQSRNADAPLNSRHPAQASSAKRPFARRIYRLLRNAWRSREGNISFFGSHPCLVTDFDILRSQSYKMPSET